MPKLKTIKIKENIHQKLVELGKKGQSFSEIIDKLIENYKNK